MNIHNSFAVCRDMTYNHYNNEDKANDDNTLWRMCRSTGWVTADPCLTPSIQCDFYVAAAWIMAFAGPARREMHGPVTTTDLPRLLRPLTVYLQGTLLPLSSLATSMFLCKASLYEMQFSQANTVRHNIKELTCQT